MTSDLQSRSAKITSDFKDKMGKIKKTIASFFSKVEDRMDGGDSLVSQLQTDVNVHMANVVNQKKELDSKLFSLNMKLDEIEKQNQVESTGTKTLVRKLIFALEAQNNAQLSNRSVLKSLFETKEQSMSNSVQAIKSHSLMRLGSEMID